MNDHVIGDLGVAHCEACEVGLSALTTGDLDSWQKLSTSMVFPLRMLPCWVPTSEQHNLHYITLDTYMRIREDT